MFLLAMIGLPVWSGDVIITLSEVIWATEKELVISMNNDVKINGLQLDLTLPDGISIEMDRGDSPNVLPTERLEGLSIISKAFPGNKYRIVAFSMSGNLVRGSEGAILRVPLKIEPEVSDGRYDVTMTNASASVLKEGKSDGTKIDNVRTIIEIKKSRK